MADIFGGLHTVDCLY